MVPEPTIMRSRGVGHTEEKITDVNISSSGRRCCRTQTHLGSVDRVTKMTMTIK